MRDHFYFEDGTYVIVDIPRNRTDARMLDQYNGQSMKVVRHKKFPSTGTYYYELEGAVSKAGVPWTFAHEWLRKDWYI